MKTVTGERKQKKTQVVIASMLFYSSLCAAALCIAQDCRIVALNMLSNMNNMYFPFLSSMFVNPMHKALPVIGMMAVARAKEGVTIHVIHAALCRAQDCRIITLNILSNVKNIHFPVFSLTCNC